VPRGYLGGRGEREVDCHTIPDTLLTGGTMDWGFVFLVAFGYGMVGLSVAWYCTSTAS